MNIKGVLKGAVFALVITFLVIFALAVVTYFTELDSKIITAGIYAGVVIGVVMGAFAAAKSSDRAVLANAMLVSLIYLAVLVIISVSLNHGLTINGHLVTMTVGILASGFLGAVLGK